MNIKIISAGAGSGKTFRLTQELVKSIREGTRPDGIIATTFTNKAAAELKERVTIKLLEEGLIEEAHSFNNALIGTVHGIGVQLLKRFAFIAGVSPKVDILPDDEHQSIFNKSLVSILSEDRIEAMELLVRKFDLVNDRSNYDWRSDVRRVADLARINDFTEVDLQHSKTKSLTQLFQFFGEAEPDGKVLEQKLLSEIKLTRVALKNNTKDATKVTQDGISALNSIEKRYAVSGSFKWHDWVSLSSLKVSKKSEDLVEGLWWAAGRVDNHPQLREDMSTYVGLIFDMAIDAIDAYADYKRRRGLIDYGDMETHIRELLKHKEVASVIAEEIDLLMVDEFQDTSPIQLDIFWKLANLVKTSIWVGDPKQAIYSFRGAEPALMEGIVDVTGGIKKENILPFSWRSREDLVNFTNVIFTKCFENIPEERVALIAKRTPSEDPKGMENGIIHWVLNNEDKPKGVIKKDWVQMAMAFSLQQWLAENHVFLPKGVKEPRAIQPGDVAILYRTNLEVTNMSRALNMAGLDSAVAGKGLTQTAEAVLVIACLRVLLSKYDSLAVAEVLKYGQGWSLEKILNNRTNFLAEENEMEWVQEEPIIEKLLELRKLIPDMTITEVLDLVLERMQIRRIVKSWSQSNQRLDNIALLRGNAQQYENVCRRIHRPSTPAGFVLYLEELAQNDGDDKSGGENPNAVNALTYHKSKGLEWPVIICGSLGGNLRVNPFGASIMNEVTKLDVSNLLANRWIRYWVNPFGKLLARSAMNKRLKESDLYANEEWQAREEEARLLYVGMTRARDFLIFPFVRGQMKWIDRVANGDGAFPLFEGEQMKELPKWKGKTIPVSFQRFDYGAHIDPVEKSAQAVVVPAEKACTTEHLPYFWDVNLDRPKNSPAFKTVEIIRFAEPLVTADMENLPEVAEAINAIIIGFREKDPDFNLPIVERILHNFRLELDAEKVLDYVTKLHQIIEEKMDEPRPQRLYLLEGKHQTRQLSLQIDFWQQTADSTKVLQNHFSGVPKRTQEKKAEELANFFSWIRELSKDKGAFVEGYVHLTLEGVVGVLWDR